MQRSSIQIVGAFLIALDHTNNFEKQLSHQDLLINFESLIFLSIAICGVVYFILKSHFVYLLLFFNQYTYSVTHSIISVTKHSWHQTNKFNIA